MNDDDYLYDDVDDGELEEKDADCMIVLDDEGNPESCGMAGTEYCDFECPNREWLMEWFNRNEN